jgi:hypothetical protein
MRVLRVSNRWMDGSHRASSVSVPTYGLMVFMSGTRSGPTPTHDAERERTWPRLSYIARVPARRKRRSRTRAGRAGSATRVAHAFPVEVAVRTSERDSSHHRPAVVTGVARRAPAACVHHKQTHTRAEQSSAEQSRAKRTSTPVAGQVQFSSVQFSL